MNSQKIYKVRYLWFLSYLFIIVGINGCAGFPSPKTVEEAPQEDIVLAMEIKAKLIEAKELNAAAIHVEASNGLVTLSGFVETESQRELATSIAKQMPNAKKVENKIKVKKNL